MENVVILGVCNETHSGKTPKSIFNFRAKMAVISEFSQNISIFAPKIAIF